MNFTVIGLGYVGLVNAVILAVYRHDVIAYDTNKEKIALLKQGVATIEEPHLQELLSQVKDDIRFTSNASDAIRTNGYIVICVDTPAGKNGAPDMSHFYAALDAIAENASMDTMVVIRSTVPVGTNAATKVYLESKSPHKFDIISAPEFLSQGRAIYDVLNPARIVVGVRSEKARELTKRVLHGYIERKFKLFITTPENAELIKYASNGFLATKISYVNTLARLCDLVGGDIDDVAKGMALDPRIGPDFLKAGVGYGGSCFPKDTSGLCWISGSNSVPMKIIKAAMEVNESQIAYFLGKIYRRFRSLSGLKVAVLGLAYKAGTEDVRNSPAFPIIKALHERNAYVIAYDPLAIDNFHDVMARFTKIRYVDYPKDALKDADFAIILTDAEEFRKLTAKDFIGAMHSPVVFDGRNIYDLKDMQGVEYYSIGRPSVKPS